MTGLSWACLAPQTPEHLQVLSLCPVTLVHGSHLTPDSPQQLQPIEESQCSASPCPMFCFEAESHGCPGPSIWPSEECPYLAECPEDQELGYSVSGSPSPSLELANKGYSRHVCGKQHGPLYWGPLCYPQSIPGREILIGIVPYGKTGLNWLLKYDIYNKTEPFNTAYAYQGVRGLMWSHCILRVKTEKLQSHLYNVKTKWNRNKQNTKAYCEYKRSSGERGGSRGLQFHGSKGSCLWSFLNSKVFTIMTMNYHQDSLALGFLHKCPHRNIKCAPFFYHQRQNTREQITRSHTAWLIPPRNISLDTVIKFN